jgi:AcrR family transcriptional regulator
MNKIDWRQRRRQEAIEEIKRAAREQISENGAGNFSLGAIARTLGMTPPALYRYFTNRDALVSALMIDAYDSMGEALEAVTVKLPDENYTGQFHAIMRAYRQWAVDFPQDYALMSGLPTSSVEMSPEEIKVFQKVVLRSMKVMVRVLHSAYKAEHLKIPDVYQEPPPGLRGALMWMQMALEDQSIPLGILAIALTTWIRADGLVWQELHGHLPKILFGNGDFYEMETRILMQQLGFEK